MDWSSEEKQTLKLSSGFVFTETFFFLIPQTQVLKVGRVTALKVPEGSSQRKLSTNTNASFYVAPGGFWVVLFFFYPFFFSFPVSF